MKTQNVSSRPAAAMNVPAGSASPGKTQPARPAAGPKTRAANSRNLDRFEAAPKSGSQTKAFDMAQARPVRPPPMSPPLRGPPRATGTQVPPRPPASFNPNPPGVDKDNALSATGKAVSKLVKELQSKHLPDEAANIYDQQPKFSRDGASEQFERLHSQMFKDGFLTDPVDRHAAAGNSHRLMNKSEQELKLSDGACTPSNPLGQEPEAAIVSKRLAEAAGVPARHDQSAISSEAAEFLAKNNAVDFTAEVHPQRFASPVLVTGQQNLEKLREQLERE